MSKRLFSTALFALLAEGFGFPSSTASGAPQKATQPARLERYSPSTPPQDVSAPRKGERATTSLPDDFYYFEGEPVRLDRSLTELVVRFKPGLDEAPRQLVLDLSPSASVGAELQVEGRSFNVVTIPLPVSGVADLEPSQDRLRSHDAVEFVAAVFHHPATGKRLLPTDEIIVKLRAGVTRQALADIAATLGLRILKPMWGTRDEYVLRLDQPKASSGLEKARLLYETGQFQWAEPNFIQEFEKSAVPNDPRFGQQWHLNNTGQGGGTPGADVKAPLAWDTQTGSAAITIAVLDTGVEKTHEDLVANIFVNPGEIASNGIDDDGNGFVDDVSGWDFSSNDNDANPSATDDNHGTAVAGVAAGRGNNAIGISGACQNCKILPIKIFNSTTFAGDTAVANAIRYAGKLADVLNNSWGGGAPSAVVQSAIQDATTTGRGGKGSPVLFAAGNSAGGHRIITGPGLPAGTHRFRWTYSKDASLSGGDDTSWLAWAVFPGGEIVNFEGGALPAGWSTGGNASWSVITDPQRGDEGRCFVRAAKAGTITNSQTTYIEAIKTVPAGDFLSFQTISSESVFDGLRLEIDLNNDLSFDLTTALLSGLPAVVPGVSFPAAHPESIAVGASSNFDCRSYYSQFGPELAFVAPSGGSSLNLRIETTDRTGALGYDPGNYTLAAGSSGFSGTSSATPLAAGIVGLLLSRNPSLTKAEVLQALQNTADKVGPEPYVAGRNNRYGFGRLNAQQALLSVSACPSISVTPTSLPAGTQGVAYSQTLSASGGAAPHGFAVTVGSIPTGMTLSAAGLLSGTPTTAGAHNFSVTATDSAGCSGSRAYSLAVNGAAFPSISLGNVSVVEGNTGTTTATFTVSLSAASPNTVTVNYATASGTATADATPLAGPWAGTTAQSRAFSFTVLPGGTQIQPLTFSMTCVTTTLAAPAFNIVNGQFSRSGSGGCTNYSVTGQFSSAVTANGTVSVVWQNLPGCPCTGSESTTWNTTPTPTVSAAGAFAEDSGKAGTLSDKVVGSLTAGADYVAALGTLSFAPGTTSKTVSVTIGGDTTNEPNETFFLNLSSPTNATIAVAQGVGTIVNDDGPVGPSPSAFHTLSPCRVVDTRNQDGPLGGPALQASAQRSFALAGTCSIPPTATAVSINVTVTGPTAPGNLRIFPGGVGAPVVSTINFSPNQTRANNAVVQLGAGGTGPLTVQNDAAGTVHFILDVNGYFE